MQLSMYIYSLGILVLTIYLLPHIRSGSAWHCLLFAQSYVVDTAINAVYTAGFTASWFMVLANHDNAGSVPGGETIGHTGGFTSPQLNVTGVDIIAQPTNNLASAAQDAVLVANGTAAVAAGDGLTNAFLNGGSIMSLVIICIFWALRGYAVAVVIAYARQVLRQHIAMTGAQSYELYAGTTTADYAENPYAIGKEEGKGLQGRIGRVMVSIGRGYWLGRDDDDQTWVQLMGHKFRKSAEEDGPAERERRRRSGTGPPMPTEGLISSAV